MLSHELRTPLTPAASSGFPARSRTTPTSATKLPRRTQDHFEQYSPGSPPSSTTCSTSAASGGGKFEPDLQHTDLRDVIRQAIQICEPDIQAREFHRASQSLYDAASRPRRPRPPLQQVSLEHSSQRGQIHPGRRPDFHGSHPEFAGRFACASATPASASNAMSLPRIFDVFEQGAVGITRRFGGLGLGLAISKAILEAHGGRHRGRQRRKRPRRATITIALPLDSDPAPTQPFCRPAIRSSPRLQPESRKNPARILLVEDHDETRDAMTRLLHKLRATTWSPSPTPSRPLPLPPRKRSTS